MGDRLPYDVLLPSEYSPKDCCALNVKGWVNIWCNLVVVFHNKQQLMIEFVKRSRKHRRMLSSMHSSRMTTYFDDFLCLKFHFLNTNIVLFLCHFQSLEERLKTTIFIYYWGTNGEKHGATTFLRERTGQFRPEIMAHSY